MWPASRLALGWVARTTTGCFRVLTAEPVVDHATHPNAPRPSAARGPEARAGRGLADVVSVPLRFLRGLRVKRFLKFNAVGALGTFVQLTVLWVLVDAGRVDYLAATIAAVSAAIIHNFVWHRRWTWRDRPTDASTALARFTLANGAVSLVGNVALMALLTGMMNMPPVLANSIAIGACGLINFWLGDTYIFRSVEVLE
jgi:putative flippase GtrA